MTILRTENNFKKKYKIKRILTCVSFYISENTFFQEHLVALRIYICIAVEILCLPWDNGASLGLVGHASSNDVTIKISYGED